MKRRVEVAGVRPASFKLLEQARDSFVLFRSARKIGTARIEEKGGWSARFEGAGGRWKAIAPSGEELLDLVGKFLLTSEARAAAALPAEKTDPALRVKGRQGLAEKLSLKFVQISQKSRLAALDAELALLRRQIEPLKS